MLGGMPGLPTTPWDRPDEPDPGPPAAADWLHAGEARHAFSHFTLTLAVKAAWLAPDAPLARGAWAAGLDPRSLPTALRRAFDLAAPVLAATRPPP
jgi:A/G-specific adenine glycosylase